MTGATFKKWFPGGAREENGGRTIWPAHYLHRIPSIILWKNDEIELIVLKYKYNMTLYAVNKSLESVCGSMESESKYSFFSDFAFSHKLLFSAY